MSEERVPLLSVDEARERAVAAGIPEYMANLSVFRILLHAPVAASGLNGLLSALLWNGALDARLRELVIMRIGWSTGSVYEWTQHWRVATQIGVDEADLIAVRDWRASDRFNEAERAVLAATDETVGDGVVSAETFAACAEHLPTPEVVELVIAIGNWRLFSSLLRTLEVPLEDGVDPWPPDGLHP